AMNVMYEKSLTIHDLTGRPFDSGKAHGHVVAEPVDCVIGRGSADWHDRKFGPPRELRRK
ncbi:MAG TPA: hypothetical protein VFL82_06985, partial [Thermomicrobiales bacterium]|nr:hypothetical protein [Thermomicrobiales bacterium]